MALKVLIRTPNHLGDTLMAMPMINEAREAHPGSVLSVLVPEYLADLFDANPAVDELIKIPTKHIHGLISVVRVRDLIARDSYDIGYILPPSFGAAAAFKLGGVGERIGYVTDGRRLLLTKALPLPEPLNSSHRSETYFNLLRRGAKASISYVPPKLFINDQDVERAIELLKAYDVGEEVKYAVVAFRAVAESRRWGKDNYVALIKEIVAEMGYHVMLIGSAADRAEGDEVVAATGGRKVVNLAGKTSLREAAAVLSQGVFFVGNDSGPAHLAASVGIPLVVLTGADDPAETSPVSTRKEVISLDHLECIHCVKNLCPLKGEEKMQCMTGISVEMVLEAISKVIEK